MRERREPCDSLGSGSQGLGPGRRQVSLVDRSTVTYSIVARDPATGELGVAVQTCMFAVGAIVPWARAGVGAVATQATGEPAYGWRCLDALERGLDAAHALDDARAADPGAVMRQVGVVDAAGNASAFTGDFCIDHAGHQTGPGYAVQANMMASPDVWPAMADAFESSRGSLAERLLAALRAAESAGGDARGCMSAAMLVVDGTRREHPREGLVVDVRVDQHDAPLDELVRLLIARDAYAGHSTAVDALFAGDPQRALELCDAALALLPGDENLRFVRVGALAFLGRFDEAHAETRGLVAGRASWETILRSFATKGLLALPPEVDLETMLR